MISAYYKSLWTPSNPYPLPPPYPPISYLQVVSCHFWWERPCFFSFKRETRNEQCCLHYLCYSETTSLLWPVEENLSKTNWNICILKKNLKFSYLLLSSLKWKKNNFNNNHYNHNYHNSHIYHNYHNNQITINTKTTVPTLNNNNVHSNLWNQ